jgi:hypothetical protein
VTDNEFACAIFEKVFYYRDDDAVNVSAVLEAVDSLTDRQKRVLDLRIRQGKTRRECCPEFKVSTPESVRQIEVKALQRLRHPSRSAAMRVSKQISSQAITAGWSSTMTRLVTPERGGEYPPRGDKPHNRTYTETGAMPSREKTVAVPPATPEGARNKHIYRYSHIQDAAPTMKGRNQMADYAKMYRKLFNSTTQAIETLQKAQQETEEMFIEAPDPDIRLLNADNPDGDETE